MPGVVKGEPVPIDDPPLATVYQLSVPAHPDAVSITVPVPHLDPFVPVGAAGMGLTVAITSVLGPSQPAPLVQETQYDVVELIPGVVNGEPVPTCVPPEAASYHFNVPPAQPTEDKLTVPVPHRDPFVPVGATGIAFTVIVTVDVAAGQGPAGSSVVNVSVTVPLAMPGV